MFRFVVRCLGLTGLLAFAAGVIGLFAADEGWRFLSALRGEQGSLPLVSAALVLIGGAVAMLVFGFEMLAGMQKAAGRRSAVGINVVVQIALAVVLLVGLNFWSFGNYLRFDATRSKNFTIKPELASQLRQLQGETTIVVYQQHKTFGRFTDKLDKYDVAAERKVVEKIKDLVELLREFGPQFRVVVLDVEDEQYDAILSAESRRFPKLPEALAAAPENSIFFCAGDRIQRMGFHEFYQLDKSESQKRENLVLLNQGIEPFVRRVLAVEEKKPRVGVAVIHELLSTRGVENEFGMAGLRKSLEANGFEVTDILLKRWSESGPPEAAVYSYDESQLDRIEESVVGISDQLSADREVLAGTRKLRDVLKNTPLDRLNEMLRDQLRGRVFTEEDRKNNLQRQEQILAAVETEIKELEAELRKAEEERLALLGSEATVEGRRMTDIKSKFRRLLDDCDLLIIPRLTLFNLVAGDRHIPYRIYRLDSAQIAAIRDFLKAGKPVLAMFGPSNEPENARDPFGMGSGPDELEALFAELGVVFGKQTILYNAESKAFAERRSNPFGSGLTVELPPLDFENELSVGLAETQSRPNPIREAMRVTKRSVGQKLDLTLRHPRPVYFATIRSNPQSFKPEFLWTDATCWNEEKPFPRRDYTPRPEFKGEDPTKRSRDDERPGPFPVGVAIQTTIPPEWTEPKYGALKIAALTVAGHSTPGGLPATLAAESLISSDAYVSEAKESATVRIAAIGHGSLFNTADVSRPDLTPAREQLLLSTCNWLLNRDDRLVKAESEWTYPRTKLSPIQEKLWRYGMFLGLPAIFAYLGLNVLLVRRMR